MTLDVYAEPFAASGSYSDIGELAAARTRLRRTYGSDGTTAARQGDGSLLVTDGAAAFTVRNNDFNVRSFRSNVVLRWEYRPGSTMYFGAGPLSDLGTRIAPATVPRPRRAREQLLRRQDLVLAAGPVTGPRRNKHG